MKWYSDARPVTVTSLPITLYIYDLNTELDLYRITRGFQRSFAIDFECQQGTRTFPDTIYFLGYVFIVEPIFPKICHDFLGLSLRISLGNFRFCFDCIRVCIYICSDELSWLTNDNSSQQMLINTRIKSLMSEHYIIQMNNYTMQITFYNKKWKLHNTTENIQYKLDISQHQFHVIQYKWENTARFGMSLVFNIVSIIFRDIYPGYHCNVFLHCRLRRKNPDVTSHSVWVIFVRTVHNRFDIHWFCCKFNFVVFSLKG